MSNAIMQGCKLEDTTKFEDQHPSDATIVTPSFVMQLGNQIPTPSRLSQASSR
jgi:hypothetical protein